MSSPAEQLSNLIVDRLIKKELISESLKRKVAEKIAAGQMDQGDWKLFFERSLDTPKK